MAFFKKKDKASLLLSTSKNHYRLKEPVFHAEYTTILAKYRQQNIQYLIETIHTR
jgi:hypothetical protein